MKKETNHPHLQRLAVGVQDAALMLGIAQQTLRNWVSAGRSPVQPVKIGARTMFRVADIHSFVNGLAPLKKTPAAPLLTSNPERAGVEK